MIIPNEAPMYPFTRMMNRKAYSATQLVVDSPKGVRNS